MDAAVFSAFAILVGLWVTFWVIRLGVRYGVDDALQRNRAWLRADGGRVHPVGTRPPAQ